MLQAPMDRGTWPAPTKKQVISGDTSKGCDRKMRSISVNLHYNFLYLFIYPDKVDFSNRRHILIDKTYTKGVKMKKRLLRTAGIIILLAALICLAFACAGGPPGPPPPARITIVKPQRPHQNAVWVEGHWDWRHRNWVWIPGHWR